VVPALHKDVLHIETRHAGYRYERTWDWKTTWAWASPWRYTVIEKVDGSLDPAALHDLDVVRLLRDDGEMISLAKEDILDWFRCQP